jgi:uncharacterized membrane protein YfcA
MVIVLKTVLSLMASLFGLYFLSDAFGNRRCFSTKPWAGFLGTGFVTNFLDTLGIGSFAQQTAVFKLFRLVDDRIIPGTMNVGNTLPTVAEALIFMSAVPVEPVTLVVMSLAAPAGSVLGAGVVARMSRRRIQLGMGLGLLAVAVTMLGGLLRWFPMGGDAIGLSDWKLALAAVLSFAFGALQTIGVGFYAPCMAIVYALGMHPRTAFPIMMTATAMLMAAGSARFVKERAYDRKAALCLTLAGVLGVFLAAWVVRSLPLALIKWVVIVAVLYTSGWMFLSARSAGGPETAPSRQIPPTPL